MKCTGMKRAKTHHDQGVIVQLWLFPQSRTDQVAKPLCYMETSFEPGGLTHHTCLTPDTSSVVSTQARRWICSDNNLPSNAVAMKLYTTMQMEQQMYYCKRSP
jgi:hypothetical protein